MVKSTDKERGNLPNTTWAILSEQQQEFFYMNHPTDRIDIPVVKHWKQEIGEWVDQTSE